MDLEDIALFLQDEQKRSSLIEKLKASGENSFACNAFRQAFQSLNVHKTPPGATQITILKHTFKFLGWQDTVKNASSVCTSWNMAAKTVIFEDVASYDLFKKDANSFQKILPSFRRISYNLSNKNDGKNEAILSACQNLISLCYSPAIGFFKNPEPFLEFGNQILSQNADSLESLYLSEIQLFGNLQKFPKLKLLEASLDRMGNPQDVQKLVETSRTISEQKHLHLKFKYRRPTDTNSILPFIAENYKENCLSLSYNKNSYPFIPKIIGEPPPPPVFPQIPAKIIKTHFGAKVIPVELPFAGHVECVVASMFSSTFYWDNFEEYLNQFPNLKYFYLDVDEPHSCELYKEYVFTFYGTHFQSPPLTLDFRRPILTCDFLMSKQTYLEKRGISYTIGPDLQFDAMVELFSLPDGPHLHFEF